MTPSQLDLTTQDLENLKAGLKLLTDIYYIKLREAEKLVNKISFNHWAKKVEEIITLQAKLNGVKLDEEVRIKLNSDLKGRHKLSPEALARAVLRKQAKNNSSF